jgi:putative transposase|tara:strand:- start:9 stop:548 length:540 start_codon:yes stop_codon:yes gene_type:complete
MPKLKPIEISLTQAEEEILHQIAVQHKAEYRLVIRAKIILEAALGKSNSQIARQLDIKRSTVIKWRNRWHEQKEELATFASEATNQQFTQRIVEVLFDKPRAGTPAKFTAEQLCQIIAVATTSPEESGRPISHWDAGQLADEVVKRKIVESISARSIGRFLKSGGVKTAPNPNVATPGD